MKINEEEYKRVINEANEAKDRLYRIAHKLENMGCARKANGAMALVYKIEAWQRSGR